jgi:aminomuconate-semialdehyde/2-hydroxymuconate-6-semialdehyde dehydrogenase
VQQFIGGAMLPPASGAYLDDIEPATGRVHARLPDGDERDVARAVAAAAAAFPAWSATPAAERARMLQRLASLIEADAEAFARAESADTGKPLAVARSVDIPRAIANFRFFATAILHAQSEAHITDHAALNYTLRRPVGVVALIAPWNLPLYLLSWKIAPALAAGCTAVAKPSELTPLSAHLLAEGCIRAGLPPGVLNIVHGPGRAVGRALVEHPGVAAISFTGGTATGTDIASRAGPRFKRLALELGGKNPMLVFADADMDRAVSEGVRVAFSNQGQICHCGSRVLVEHSAFPSFLERFVDRVRRLRVGDPLEPTTEQGALVSAAHREKVMRYIELAREEGGTVHCGGGPPADLPERCREGFFVEPTVITGLPMNCRVNQEEVFGPVVTITAFDAEDQALELANATSYGLSATLWTENLTRAHRVADRLACGTVWVNCWMLRDLRVPIGGVARSGVGREGGEEALRFFTEPKNVCIALGADSGPAGTAR